MKEQVEAQFNAAQVAVNTLQREVMQLEQTLNQKKAQLLMQSGALQVLQHLLTEPPAPTVVAKPE